jgi:hypothetical protein
MHQDVQVVVNDGNSVRILRPAASQKVRNHSPDGFEYGYAGSGPSQLALAICLDHLKDAKQAESVYMPFKFGFITPMPAQGGDITGDQIDEFVNNLEANRKEATNGN